MKVIFKNTGNSSLESITEQFKEIVSGTIGSLKRDKDVDVESAHATEIEFTVALNVKGQEDPVYLNVEHHEGFPETFTWEYDMETQDKSNNEYESLISEENINLAQGKEVEFQEINSLYDEQDLHLEKENRAGDMLERIFTHNETGEVVVQYYQQDRLVQEVHYEDIEALGESGKTLQE